MNAVSFLWQPAAILLAMVLSLSAETLTLRSGGSVRLPNDPEGFIPTLKVDGCSPTPMGDSPATKDGVSYDFISHGEKLATGFAKLNDAGDGKLSVSWEFILKKPFRDVRFGAVCSLDVGRFPPETFDVTNRSGFVRIENLLVTLPNGVKADYYDGRWHHPFHSCYNVRIHGGHRKDTKIGERIVFACEFSSVDGSPLQSAFAGNLFVAESNGWIRVDHRKTIVPGSALDFSNMGFQDAPAGKYGWPVFASEHVEFENLRGRSQRFCGVNLCGEANYPENPEKAVRLAERLARLGYNAIRVHHHDDCCAHYVGGHLELIPEMMDRLDRFLAECFRRGIYATTDLYVSRKIRWRDIGVDRDGDIKHPKLWQITTERGWDDWSAFARLFMEHVNPYTGRAYKDEPAMPFVCIKNESVGGGIPFSVLADDPEFKIRDLWMSFLKNERVKNPESFPSFSPDRLPKDGLWWDAHGLTAVKSAFWAELDTRFVRRATDYLRKIGVKAMLTAENCGPTPAYIQEMRDACYGYSDAHMYVCGWWEWLAKRSYTLPFKTKNLNPFQPKSTPLDSYGYQRLWGKPFTITEWDFVGPSHYRSVGGLAFGAMASIQDWDGIWRFAYEHGGRNLDDNTGAPELYNLARDPLKLASDRATLFLYLRGDMPTAEPMLSLDFDEASLDRSLDHTYTSAPAWTRNNIAWTRRVGVNVRGRSVPPRASVFPMSKVNTAVEPPVPDLKSPFVELDRVKGTFVVRTPRTAGVFADGGTFNAGDVVIRLDDPATVFVNSLDASPIRSSRRILVTHLTDARGDGARYLDDAMHVAYNWGGGSDPADRRVLLKKGVAHVALALSEPDRYEIWALGTDGRRECRIDATVKKNRLVFKVNVEQPFGGCMLYEIVRSGTR